MMVVTLAILVALWVAIEQCDAAKTDAGANTDAGADTGADAGADADAGSVVLSPHEREEAAKDELARAREALETGDFGAASAALDAAAGFDPSNPDIEELRAQLQNARPDGG